MSTWSHDRRAPRPSAMICRMGSDVVSGAIAWFSVLIGVAFLVRLGLGILAAAYLAGY
jgi:hypothetical protein